MTDPFKLGIVPMTSTDQVDVNLDAILKSLDSFKNETVHLVCFPENSLYFNFQKNLDPSHALNLMSPVWNDLKARASAMDTYLLLGGLPLEEEGHIYNASVLVTPHGDVKTVYRKIHLFDIELPGKEVKESKSFSAGSDPAVIDILGYKIGLSICYDVRFSELYLKYAQSVDVILVPSSFLVPTGRAHWATLLKARAIETQAYVVAPAQVGTHQSGLDPALKAKETWGESIAFDPWGECLGRSLSFDDLKSPAPVVVRGFLDPDLKDAQAQSPLARALQPFTITLDKPLIQKTRTQMPMGDYRKL